MKSSEFTSPGLRWAIGPDSDKAKFQYVQQDPERMIVWINIPELFSKCDPDLALDPTDVKGGKNAIGNRVEKAIDHWTRDMTTYPDGHTEPFQGWMDPPEVHFNDHYKRMGFSDGRHRLVASYQLGHEWAPVLIYREQLPKIRKILSIKKK